nr:hypothetical protein [Tanacetum cinerariifolium]
MAQATQSTSLPSQYVPPPPQYVPAPLQAPQSTNDAILATMNQIVNLLSGFQKQFPPTNNQLRTSTNPMTQAMIQAGQITIESVQRRALGNKGKHAATGSQGKVDDYQHPKESLCHQELSLRNLYVERLLD